MHVLFCFCHHLAFTVQDQKKWAVEKALKEINKYNNYCRGRSFTYCTDTCWDITAKHMDILRILEPVWWLSPPVSFQGCCIDHLGCVCPSSPIPQPTSHLASRGCLWKMYVGDFSALMKKHRSQTSQSFELKNTVMTTLFVYVSRNLLLNCRYESPYVDCYVLTVAVCAELMATLKPTLPLMSIHWCVRKANLISLDINLIPGAPCCSA